MQNEMQSIHEAVLCKLDQNMLYFRFQSLTVREREKEDQVSITGICGYTIEPPVLSEMLET